MNTAIASPGIGNDYQSRTTFLCALGGLFTKRENFFTNYAILLFNMEKDISKVEENGYLKKFYEYVKFFKIEKTDFLHILGQLDKSWITLKLRVDYQNVLWKAYNGTYLGKLVIGGPYDCAGDTIPDRLYDAAMAAKLHEAVFSLLQEEKKKKL